MSYYLISLPLPNPSSIGDLLLSDHSSNFDKNYYAESLNTLNNTKIDNIYKGLKNGLLSTPAIFSDVKRWDIPSLKVRIDYH